jgi:hypothetical protein
MDDWTPEQRPVPVELTTPANHAIYSPPVEFPELMVRLSEAKPSQLLALAKHVI